MTTTRRTGAVDSGAQTPAGANLRLYLIAALALTYLLALIGFTLRTPGSETAATEPPQSPIGAQGGAVWYGDLPGAQRPALRLAPGWRVVEPGEASAYDAPPPVQRISSLRRIRTRSS
jgi:hypothetical protein